MRIAVLGAAGQLGRDLCTRLPGEVVPLSRADIDLEQLASPPLLFASGRPDFEILINCAAYNLVDRAEEEPARAFAVNGLGVRALAACCATHGIKLVHYSTDYVFGLDAARSTPLTEDDPPGPVSAYGLSKLVGECAVRAASPANLVIRTCGLYGLHGSGGKGGNFVETMLRVAGQGKPLRVVDDQRCTPSYTVDVAEVTAALLRAGTSGLFHVTNAGSCSWYEFAEEIFRLAGLKPSLTPIASSEYGAQARRPAYSVLSNAKLTTVGIPAPRAWREALGAYMTERNLGKK